MDKEYVVYIGYTDEDHIYIGISKEPETRWAKHRNNSSNIHVKNLINKGYEFYFEILQDGLTIAEAETLELKLIEKYILEDYSVLNIRTCKTTPNTLAINREQHKKCLLTYNDIYAIRKAWQESKGCLNQTELAQKYNVSLSTIHNIIKNKRWYDPQYIPVLTKKLITVSFITLV